MALTVHTTIRNPLYFLFSTANGLLIYVHLHLRLLLRVLHSFFHLSAKNTPCFLYLSGNKGVLRRKRFDTYAE